MLLKSILKTALLASSIIWVNSSFAIDKNKNRLPQISTAGISALSIEKEKIIGDLMMRQLRGQAPIVGDPVLDDYLNDLGNRLVAQAEDVKYPFEFFWIQNNAINAFAFFGGHIGVHTGLIVAADTESELASVLAHEVAHVTQRHIARRIEAQQRNAPLTIAGMLGGILLAMANPEAGIAAITATQAGTAQFGINYTRKNEQEADAIGLRTLGNAGFDQNGAASFFGKLAAKYRMQTKPPAFLLTHPLPESRVAEIKARIAGKYQPRRGPGRQFLLAKARVLARYARSPEDNISYFEQQIIKSDKANVPAQYGLALSYFEDKQYKKAEQLINQLLYVDKDNLFFIDTATDIAIANQKYDYAIALLEGHLQRLPHNKVITLNLANTLIEAKRYDKAILTLRDFLLLNPENSLAYNLLATAYAKTNNYGQMHQARAELYALMAAYPRAIDELHTAYTFSNQAEIEKKRIRARIKQFKDEQQRLKEL